MPVFMKFDGVDGDVNAAHSPDNVEMIIKVLDGGTSAGGGTGVSTYYDLTDQLELGELAGATTNVEYTRTVTDTQTGITERESGLVYSGESGGMNESMETMKKAWKDASSTPEGAERDKASADGSYLEVKLPDLLVSSFQTGDAPAEAGGGFDAQGRLLVGTDGGLFGSSIDPNPPSWGLDRIDQRASGSGGGDFPWQLSMRQTGADGDARSGTHEVGHWIDPTTPSAPVSELDAGYDYDAPGRLLVTTDAAPPERQAILKMFSADYVGDGDPPEAHWHAGGASWGIDRIDQHDGFNGGVFVAAGDVAGDTGSVDDHDAASISALTMDKGMFWDFALI